MQRAEQIACQAIPNGFKPRHVRQIYAFLDQLAESTRLERVQVSVRIRGKVSINGE
jgi:hypothetical protein